VTTSLIVLACELLFSAALGLGAALWYDHKGLDRLSPDLIGCINRTVDQAVADRAGRTEAGPAIGAGQPSDSRR
jgi:hypothetical protein